MTCLDSSGLGLRFGIKNVNLGKKNKLMLFMIALQLFVFSNCAAKDNFQIAIIWSKIEFCNFLRYFW